MTNIDMTTYGSINTLPVFDINSYLNSCSSSSRQKCHLMRMIDISTNGSKYLCIHADLSLKAAQNTKIKSIAQNTQVSTMLHNYCFSFISHLITVTQTVAETCLMILIISTLTRHISATLST